MITHERPYFFKYATASTTLAILANSSVRWSSPNLFNDPFDIQFDLRIPFSREEYRSAVSKRLYDFFENGRSTPVNVDNPSTQLFNALLDIMKCRAEDFNADQFVEQVMPSLDASYDAMLQSLPKYHGETKEMLNDVCVFCVSEVPDSLLMWSHYADSHRGALIKLRCLPEYDTALCAAVPVKYADDIPPFATLNGIVESAFGVSPLRGDHLFHVLTATKSSEWSYEREWRTITTFRNKAQHEAGYADYKILPEEIEEIILGCKIAEADREKIVELAAEKYPDAIVSIAKKHPGKYALEFEPLVNGDT
ncbi:DUF2971 domain-containing protein [Terasakiella pusilla]|uniref:DUF2971 domain-containing protein n=1 Tax=Terasakiella pusilla TaxID=64973 RepID=UPI003AA9ABD4